MKKEFNSLQARTNSEHIDGERWYQIQAFRALNQAFGRCLRHSRDWGAIILVDDRYREKKYMDDVSKWLRALCRPVQNYGHFLKELGEFQSTNHSRTELEKNETLAREPLKFKPPFVSEPMDTTPAPEETKENRAKPVYAMFNKVGSQKSFGDTFDANNRESELEKYMKIEMQSDSLPALKGTGYKYGQL